MIPITERMQLIRDIESGKINRVKNDQQLFEYYDSIATDYEQELMGYDYDKRQNHIDYLRLFAMGKLITYIDDQIALSRATMATEDKILKMIALDERYNVDFHNTELQNIGGQADNAQFEKDHFGDEFQNWRYLTQRDSKVRESHRLLDGVVLDKNNGLWDLIQPYNGWNCRCYLESTNDEVTPDSTVRSLINKVRSDLVMEEVKEGNMANVDVQWAFNPAKEDYILPQDHTYIKALENMQYRRLYRQFNTKRMTIDNGV